MSVENNNLQQGEQIQETPAPETDQIDSSNQNTDTSSERVAQSEDNIPFHKHPRWQEVMEKARVAEERSAQYQSQLEQYQSKMTEMERRFQQFSTPKPEVNPFVAKLREIDPKYGEWAESIEGRASQAETLAQELQQMKYERLIERYESSVDKLHNEHKTAPEVRELIKDQLDAMAQSNRIGMKDLPQVYKSLADKYGKMFENLKRSTTANYVQDKAKDGASPASQPKGKAAPVRNNKGQFTGDRETDLANLAKRAVRISRGEGDL